MKKNVISFSIIAIALLVVSLIAIVNLTPAWDKFTTSIDNENFTSVLRSTSTFFITLVFALLPLVLIFLSFDWLITNPVNTRKQLLNTLDDIESQVYALETELQKVTENHAKALETIRQHSLELDTKMKEANEQDMKTWEALMVLGKAINIIGQSKSKKGKK